MHKRNLLLIAAVFLFSAHAFATQFYENWPDIAGPYLGQEPPGMTAEMFAPGIISTDRSEINSVFAPHRNEFYFTTWSIETGTKIMVTTQIDGRWTAPEVASISNRTETDWTEEQYLGPVVNSGKSQIYSTSTRDGTLYFQAITEEEYGNCNQFGQTRFLPNGLSRWQILPLLQ